MPEAEFFPDYVERIDSERALGLLEEWAAAGGQHGLLLQGKGCGFVCTIVTILKVRKELIVCGPKPSTFIFNIDKSRFGLGAYARMEIPEQRDSSVTGLHIYMESGSYLFISYQAQLPDLPLIQATDS